MRDEALLSIVLVSDQDDASAGSVSSYVDFLTGLKPASTSVTVSSIRPLVSPRLDAFENEFDIVSLADIKNSDWSEAMSVGTSLFAQTLGFSCLDLSVVLTDTRIDEPGLQPDCVATFMHPTDGETLVPACSMRNENSPDLATALPCWWLEPYEEGGDLCTQIPRVEVLIGPEVPFVTLRCGCDN